MLNPKNYLKILFLLLGTVFLGAFVYLYFYAKTYPLPITNRVSLDAKIKFIKENVARDKIRTIIIGSSIGLNNIQGKVLEENCNSCASVLNISFLELRATQAEQMMELLTLFPHLKRVIYSVQFSDFSAPATIDDFNPKLIKKYITNEMSYIDKITLAGHTYKNVLNCIDRQWNWEKKHMADNKFSYLDFDHTGSAPLKIYGKDIIKSRWEIAHPDTQDESSFQALERMAKKLDKSYMDFYVVLQPYRTPLIDEFKHLKPTMEKFSKRVENILSQSNGTFIDIHNALHLGDDYFADRSHLNDKGSLLVSEAIAKLIDRSK